LGGDEAFRLVGQGYFEYEFTAASQKAAPNGVPLAIKITNLEPVMNFAGSHRGYAEGV